jgi:hypothetical protein
MQKPSDIHFHELSAVASDFLHELNDPSILRNRSIPPRAAVELKKQQILRLKDSIKVLTAKRDEFHRRTTEYIGSLETFLRALEREATVELAKIAEPEKAAVAQATFVRCHACETEMVFSHLQIIFARDSDESLALPTEVYVLEEGILKKGHFRCHACGTESLVIRAC